MHNRLPNPSQGSQFQVAVADDPGKGGHHGSIVQIRQGLLNRSLCFHCHGLRLRNRPLRLGNQCLGLGYPLLSLRDPSLNLGQSCCQHRHLSIRLVQHLLTDGSLLTQSLHPLLR